MEIRLYKSNASSPPPPSTKSQCPSGSLILCSPIKMWVLAKAKANPAVGLLGVLVSSFLAIRFVFPFSTHFLTTTLPSFWIAGRVFLVRPYLFFLLNFIIVVIWILSDRHTRHPSSSTHDKQRQPQETPITHTPKVVSFQPIAGFPSLPASETESFQPIAGFPSLPAPETESLEPIAGLPSLPASETGSFEPTAGFPSLPASETESDDQASSVAATCHEMDAEYNFPPTDTTPAVHLNYEAPVDQEDESLSEFKTMDATWESIMAVTPARKVLEKSKKCKEAARVDNFNTPAITVISKENAHRSKMKKSEPCTEANSRRRAPVRRMEMEEIGSAELNLQYEAFIKRRHKQLLLEKQESNQRKIDMMIKTGVQIIDN